MNKDITFNQRKQHYSEMADIEPKYTIDQAVEDKAVVRLLYEGRHAVQEVDHKPIDSWFERVSMGLTPEQKVDLKKKFSNADHLNMYWFSGNWTNTFYA